MSEAGREAGRLVLEPIVREQEAGKIRVSRLLSCPRVAADVSRLTLPTGHEDSKKE